MPLPPPRLPWRVVPALGLLLLAACATVRPPAPPALAAPTTPAGPDALPRWREHFPACLDTVAALELSPAAEAADTPPPDIPAAALAPARALLDCLVLAPDETFAFAPVHGPESPFPDHQPLRLIASLRTLAARRALADGDAPAALALVRQNLAQARATLRAQDGIVPLIHAAGVWQSALDGAHALARSPALPAADARALLAELQTDAGLAHLAADRMLRGEYARVFRVIVERMPRTDDPDLALSAVSSLGMSKPEPLEPGELGLGPTDHVLLDPAATLSAYEADLAPYLAALARSARFPRGLYAAGTAVTLARYKRELGAFETYASGEGPATLELVALARGALEATPNPVGKLLALYLTPPWEVLIATADRREAQRAAICGLLAWRVLGRPAPWDEIVAAGILPAPPADPFSDGPLRCELGEHARVWSVYLNGADDGGQPVEGNTGQPPDLVWLW